MPWQHHSPVDLRSLLLRGQRAEDVEEAGGRRAERGRRRARAEEMMVANVVQPPGGHQVVVVLALERGAAERAEVAEQ